MKRPKSSLPGLLPTVTNNTATTPAMATTATKVATTITPTTDKPNFFATPTFKLVLLAGMVAQNSATVLVGRYTRAGIRPEDRYVVNHLIIVSEIGKLLLSCLLEHYTTGGRLVQSIRENIVEKPRDALKISIPAMLYLLQNTLLYVALANLTAPLFQVTYQTKLVTTAVVSVFMLNRQYQVRQWICLVTLSLGVAVVVLDNAGKDSSGASSGASSSSSDGQSMIKGLTAVSVACCSSALAGVYFEKVVKGKVKAGEQIQAPVSLWMRNIQLAFYTIVVAMLKGVWSEDPSTMALLSGWWNYVSGSTAPANTDPHLHYLHGFTFWPWVLVCLQAGGGLLVAAVIKYADNVLKGLATGVSVCVATAVSTVLFGTPLTLQFIVGASVILTSVYFFSNPLPARWTGDRAPAPVVSTPQGELVDDNDDDDDHDEEEPLRKNLTAALLATNPR